MEEIMGQSRGKSLIQKFEVLNISNKSAPTTFEKPNGLIDVLVSWSLEDIFNKQLYQTKVNLVLLPIFIYLLLFSISHISYCK